MKRLEKLLSLAVVCGSLACSMPASAATTVYFRDSDRVILKEYVTTKPSGTVTFYERGTVLPGTVTYTELPVTVTERLVAPPPGASYVMIDGNAYLVDTQKRIIIDAERLYD